MLPTSDDLIETFSLLEDWEQRYSYLIDLGKKLPEMPLPLKTDKVLVAGCTSRVWMVARSVELESDQSPPRFHFEVDSDAAIVKGLVAVLMVFVQDRTAAEIAAVDLPSLFARLHLEAHLSPSRRNGFFSMIERINRLTTAPR